MRTISPRGAAFTLACLIAFAVAGDLLWMPVQVHDAVEEIMDAQQSASVGLSFVNGLDTTTYLRPMRIAQTKALFDLAGDEHYWLVYRGFHALLLVTAVLLFVAVLRVSTWIDFAASAFALLVLVGLHTFRGTVQEAFPVNHFLETVVFCLIALNLARSRGGWWADAAAAVAFGLAALTLESGLIVWVVSATAWAVGWRGVSARGVAVLTVLAAGYLCLRFGYLSTGLPGPLEHSSGYLFTTLDPPELQQRFGEQPIPFYAYNVAASALSVLFSEPRAGVFVATREWLEGDILPRMILAVATSTATTALLVWAALRARQQRTLDDPARLLALGVVALAANSVLSYAYTKDEIISLAGTFYAIAAFAAIRAALGRVERLPRAAAVVLMVCAAALSAGWSVRAAGVHYLLRTQAFRVQNDWVHLPRQWREDGLWPTDPTALRLVQRLHDDAVGLELPNSRVAEPWWTNLLWED